MSKKPSGFRQKLNELESILEWFESHEADPDSALEKFEQGMELIKELEQKLQSTENRIEEIRHKLDADSDKATDNKRQQPEAD